MDFNLQGHTIYANGIIRDGDAAKLAQIIYKNNLSSGCDEYTVKLNSPIGSQFEGIRIGRLIRDARLLTFVSRGDACVGAGAFAFLGGTRRNPTGVGAGRRMEWGATLGFNTFPMGPALIHIDGMTVPTPHVLSALFLQYGLAMKCVDLEWFARALTATSFEPYYVRSPADITALSINLGGIPEDVPSDWHLNACRRALSEMGPEHDNAGCRVSAQSEIIPTVAALRSAVVAARFEPGPLESLVSKLSDSDAIDMAIGEQLYLGTRNPILGARSVDIDGGVGCSYDRCIAVRTKDNVFAILIDGSNRRIRLKTFDKLAAFESGSPLFEVVRETWADS